MPKTAIIFGAGATKACGGPQTDEILPWAFGPLTRWPDIFSREGMIEREVGNFLKDVFGVDAKKAQKEDFPPLPLLLSLVDTAIDRNEALSGVFGGVWDRMRLLDVRRSFEYLIFAVLQHSLSHQKGSNTPTSYDRLLRLVRDSTQDEPIVITLNYDLLAEHAMMRLSGAQQLPANPIFPDFGCSVATDAVKRAGRFGTLLKIHGSLDFLYCPGCQRLDVALSPDGRPVKALNDLFQEQHDELDSSYSCRGRRCGCGVNVQPIMITPTALKDYRNPHVSRIWYEAHRHLREAERVIIVGYSLPSDDVHVIYLLKRALGHLEPAAITVVVHDERRRNLVDHPVGRQYRALFGDGIDWRTEGFSEWLDRLTSAGVDIVSGRLPN